jgi:hypothetical protein
MPPCSHVIGLILLTAMLPACAPEIKTAAIVVKSPSISGCRVFQPMTYSKLDTKPTVMQIRGFNRARANLCKS